MRGGVGQTALTCMPWDHCSALALHENVNYQSASAATDYTISEHESPGALYHVFFFPFYDKRTFSAFCHLFRTESRVATGDMRVPYVQDSEQPHAKNQ